jgi:hypothetical protein
VIDQEEDGRMEEVERLCTLLGDEARLWGDVAGLLCEERDAVSRLRTSAILACLEEHQVLQDELSRVADRRWELVRGITRACGTESERANELLPLLPPAPQARVKAGLQVLRRALLRARGLERQSALPGGSLGRCWS